MPEPTPADVSARRDELDISLDDVGKRLARMDRFDLAASTLSTYVSEIERGDRDPEGDLPAIMAAIEDIDAERNPDYPPCERCKRKPAFPPDELDDGRVVCIVCGETIKRERRRNSSNSGTGTEQ